MNIQFSFLRPITRACDHYVMMGIEQMVVTRLQQ